MKKLNAVCDKCGLLYQDKKTFQAHIDAHKPQSHTPTPELVCSIADLMKRNGYTDEAVLSVVLAVNSYEGLLSTLAEIRFRACLGGMAAIESLADDALATSEGK